MREGTICGGGKNVGKPVCEVVTDRRQIEAGSKFPHLRRRCLRRGRPRPKSQPEPPCAIQLSGEVVTGVRERLDQRERSPGVRGPLLEAVCSLVLADAEDRLRDLAFELE